MRPDGSRTSDYEYDLPPDRIARYPAGRRDESRLLVLTEGGDLRHFTFAQIVELIDPGDVLVVNESRVLPARLLGHKPTGAPSEVLLVRPADVGGDPLLWEALVRPGSKLKPGRRVVVADDLSIEILDSTQGGGRVVRRGDGDANVAERGGGAAEAESAPATAAIPMCERLTWTAWPHRVSI